MQFESKQHKFDNEKNGNNFKNAINQSTDNETITD